MLLCLLLIFTHLHINFRVQLPCAIRADAVGEVGFGVRAYIDFHLVPVTLVVTDFFTARADGHDAAQGLNLYQRFLKFSDQPLTFIFNPPALGYILSGASGADYRSLFIFQQNAMPGN